MKPLLACTLLIFIATACKATVPIDTSRVVIASPTTRPSPSPVVEGQTPAITTSVPTNLQAPTVTATTLPCDPALNACIEAGHFLLDRPIALPGTNTIDRGYPFGSTEGGTREPHHGVEFYDASGTPVLAAGDGLVITAGNDKQTKIGPRLNFYGNVIILEHHFPGNSQPIYTLYGHLSKVDVQPGQMVQSGERIGEVGATGEAIGSHLHFEVRVGQNNYDSTSNPVLWLKPLTGRDGTSYGVIAGQLMDAGGKTLSTTNINIQYFLATNQPQAAAYPIDTYATGDLAPSGDEAWNENFSLGDIPAGIYRISIMWDGVLYDRRMVVLPGKLTFVVMKLDR